MMVRAHRALFGVLVCVAGAGGLGVALPDGAGAYATIAPPPLFSSAPGLPDGRVYEQVSPGNKHGYGVETSSSALGVVANATAAGDGIMYKGEGPIAEGAATGNNDQLFVSQRSAGQWSTRAAQPSVALGLHEPEENADVFEQSLAWMLPSADLSRVAFSQKGADVGPPDERALGNNLYLEGSDPLIEPVWVGRPEISMPRDGLLALVGGSPDLSTLYFAFGGTLFLEDGPRGKLSAEIGGELGAGVPGFYEYKNGVLSEAGVLPDGSVSAFGAAPASLPVLREPTPSASPDQTDGQVSADGSRAFFVSPSPVTSSATPYVAFNCAGCTAAPPQLYVRETMADGSQRTVLVSQSQLTGHLGEAALDGPLPMTNTAPSPKYRYPNDSSYPSYVFASPDGSHAFFQSVDRLTEAAPSGPEVKTYAFDLQTDVLTYLPGVSGSIVVSARDGSSFLFENTATSPFELDRWVAGANGGSVTPIVQLPGFGSRGPEEGCGKKFYFKAEGPQEVCVGPARISGDGSVVVFTTESPIAGFNDGGGFQQIFRYDSKSDELSCVSCPPAGVAPSGDAVISITDFETSIHDTSSFSQTNDAIDTRGMSADGGRVFFDAPAPLVAQDVNGQPDVYEWENGRVFLLSSGSSGEGSVFLDSSESGGDVFFQTSSELAPGDNDGAFDVYDARVPRPGDNPPPTAVPCQGEVCQGPPSVPQLLSAPSSATFSGLGNISPPSQTEGQAKAKSVKAKSGKGKRKKSRRKAGSRKKRRRAVRSGVVAARGGYGRGK